MSALLAPRTEFRPMTERDLDAVAAVERIAHPSPWTRGNFADALNAGYSAWVMDIDGEIAAYVIFMVAVGEGHLLNITVAPPWRRRGLARRMISELKTICRERGAEAVYLEVRVSNLPAQALYRAAGFEEISRRRRYYPAREGREDAVLMLASL